jgi:hypothetical protein
MVDRRRAPCQNQGGSRATPQERTMAGKTPQRPSTKKPPTKSIKEKRQAKQQKKQQKRGLGG